MRLALEAEAAGQLTFLHRHRVRELGVTNGRVTGAAGDILAPTRRFKVRRPTGTVTGAFEITAPKALVLASGGIGGNHARVRQLWPRERLGKPPAFMVAGVPDYVDGSLHEAATPGRRASDQRGPDVALYRGSQELRPDLDESRHPHPARPVLAVARRAWHPDGSPCFPGFDTLATLKRILQTGHDHSWFILTQKIIEKEFALSGLRAEPRHHVGQLARRVEERLSKGATNAVEAFKTQRRGFRRRRRPRTLITGMNALEPDTAARPSEIRTIIEARDREIDQPLRQGRPDQRAPRRRAPIAATG